MTEHYFVSAIGVLGVQTNVRHFKWSWGINMPPATKSDFDSCAVKLRLIVEDDVSRSNIPGVSSDEFGKFHYFSGVPGADSVYYERTFMGNRMLKMRVDGLTSGSPTLRVNKTYFKYVTHRFMNLHSVGYIMTDIAGLLLLRAGYAPLHCSAFATDDSTVLVLAAPNTGKTLTAMTACIDLGTSFLAEDLAITDGTNVFAVPWTSTFRYYSEVDSRLSSRVANRLTSVVPAFELIGNRQVESIEAYVPPERILTSSRVSHVALLERGARGVRECPLEEATQKAVTLNRYEFNYMKAPTLVAYEYFNPALALQAAVEREVGLVSDVIKQANEVVAVRSGDASEYASMIVGRVG